MPKYASSISGDPQKVRVSYGSDGQSCLDPRQGKSDVGRLVTPPGAPGPESKGSIKVPEQL
jgi:hypothetical protein